MKFPEYADVFSHIIYIYICYLSGSAGGGVKRLTNNDENKKKKLRIRRSVRQFYFTT